MYASVLFYKKILRILLENMTYSYASDYVLSFCGFPKFY